MMGALLSNVSSRVSPDPAPLGLAAFGGTTFMLSLFNSGISPSLISTVLPTAFLFGGVVQLVAGIIEFRQGGTFGATGFSAFGGFWMSFAVYERLIVPTLPAGRVHTATGVFLAPFAVIAFYLAIATLRTNAVILTLLVGATATLTILCIASFLDSDELTRAGGASGIATSAVAFYGSFAGLVNSTWGHSVIPTFPDPGRRLAHRAHRKPRPSSITSSIGDHEALDEDEV
jgi:succinate-acetate transporter protein